MLVDGDFNVNMENPEGATRAEKKKFELSSRGGVDSRSLGIKLVMLIVGTRYIEDTAEGSSGGGRIRFYSAAGRGGGGRDI